MKKSYQTDTKLNFLQIIRAKRDAHNLEGREIQTLIEAYMKGLVPDYQMSSFLMAVYFQGMSAEETYALTNAMLHSGKIFSWPGIKKAKIDKHSTGGVGDKTSLILSPLLASAGFAVPMISGRALAHTGGTIDKLESIPGMRTDLKEEEFTRLVSSIGAAMAMQTEDICPADKRIYALRDLSATVDSIPLIVASILSKKLAEGLDALVLDIKVGSGAFMKTLSQGRELAKALLQAGKKAGKKIRIILSDMSEPLGSAVGNAIEVNECVDFLRLRSSEDPVDARLYGLTMELAVEMFLLGKQQEGKKSSPKEARSILEDCLYSGAAYAKFLELLSLQGADTEALDMGLPLAPVKFSLKSTQNGYMDTMNAEAIGLALVDMGGGRRTVKGSIDPRLALYFHKHIGDEVKKGDTLVSIYARSMKEAKNCSQSLEKALFITKKKTKRKPYILDRMY